MRTTNRMNQPKSSPKVILKKKASSFNSPHTIGTRKISKKTAMNILNKVPIFLSSFVITIQRYILFFYEPKIRKTFFEFSHIKFSDSVQ